MWFGISAMKKFSIFHVPFLSFYSKELYRDVGLHWTRTGFVYLLLLLAICWIPLVIQFRLVLTDFVDIMAPPVIKQIPEITIIDGEASIKEPQPYYIRVPETADVLAIIDTTGTINSLYNTDAVVLLTKTTLIVRNEIETRTFRLSEVGNYTLNQPIIWSWLDTGIKFFAPVFYPLAVLGSFFFRIIQALIYAAIGLLFASRIKAKLSYSALLRLAIVAVTPCIIVKTVLNVAGVHLPVAGLWYFLGAMGYLSFGVKACSEPTQPQYLRSN